MAGEGQPERSAPAGVRVGGSGSVRDDRYEPSFGGILGAGLASALIFSLLRIPLVNFLVVLAPFPVVVQRLARGAVGGFVSALLAAILIGATSSSGFGVLFFVFLALPGLLIGEAMARGRGMPRGCAWAFALLAAEIGLTLLFAAPRVAEALVAPFDASSPVLQGVRTSGLPAEQIDEFVEQFKALHSAMEIVYPAVFVIFGAIVVLSNAALLRAYLLRRDPGWLEAGEFESIRLPLGLSVVFVLAGATIVLPPVRPAAYNILLLLAFFFTLQGLAVVSYYAARLAGPRIFRMAVVLLVLVNPWVFQILALVGLFDLWFDFRKWADPPPAA